MGQVMGAALLIFSTAFFDLVEQFRSGCEMFAVQLVE